MGLLKCWIAWIMCINSNIFYLPKFLVKAIVLYFSKAGFLHLRGTSYYWKVFSGCSINLCTRLVNIKTFLVCGLGRCRRMGKRWIPVASPPHSLFLSSSASSSSTSEILMVGGSREMTAPDQYHLMSGSRFIQKFNIKTRTWSQGPLLPMKTYLFLVIKNILLIGVGN